MKLFEHNLTKENLMLNATIYYTMRDDFIIKVRIPKIKETLDDPDFNVFISLLVMEPDAFKKLGVRGIIKNTTSGFIASIRESKMIREGISPFVEKYLLNSNLSTQGIMVEDKLLSFEEIDFFKIVMLVAFGIKDLDDVLKEKEEEEDLSNLSEREIEMIQKQKAVLEKLEKAKKKKTSSDGVDMPKIITGVMKEFGMSLEDIRNLNYFTLYYLFSFVFKIDHYDFMKKAAASGNLSKKTKIKHWLE